MNLDQLKEQLAKDLEIDFTNLQLMAARNPILYSQWMNRHADIRKIMLQHEASKKRLSKTKLDYYSGRSDDCSFDRYERSEMKTVMGGDDEMVKIETTIEYYQILLEYCSGALDAIRSRGFSIKHIIDLRTFESGA
ncbi:UvsY [Acinetobacter phage Ac42]|uniref:UvsY n=1 Tax=Acinetobacter phage Ac42 TaxID=762660 RepID=UPI0001EBCDB9|nr:UvsY [Acinetobacter phage Ac42]ADI96429.1 UvsY [Acinetobacter phage Ac42]